MIQNSKSKEMREQPFYTVKSGVSNSFSYGWQIMKEYFVHILLIVIVVGIANGPQSTFKAENFGFLTIMFGFFALMYSLLFLPVIKYGAQYLYLQAVRGEEIDYKELINGFFKYTDIIFANLIAATITVVGFIFFIIPGIICAVRFSFVPYLVMDKNLDPVKAVEESWRMTRGHSWQIFWMGILSFFIAVGGLICFIVGIFPALIWIHTSFATMYQAVLNEENNQTFLV